MRCVVPYTARHPATIAGAPEWAEWIEIEIGEPDAYWRALVEVWQPGDDLLIIEHDVVCRPDVVERFDRCDGPWCLHGYSDMCHPECQEAWRNQLGCTRFRSELIEAVPDALTSIPPGYGRDWHNLCDGIGGRLRAAGFSHHWHQPPVEHHHMSLAGIEV